MYKDSDEMLKKAKENIKFLRLLAKDFPTINAASTEIINLQAILNLPKGTEHFLSDIHGEYESFIHVLKNASGVIKRKINDIFEGTLTEKEKRALATLIYYPEEKMAITKNEVDDLSEWYELTLYRLIKIARVITSKYTKSKVRKTLSKDFAYIIEELIYENSNRLNKEEYYKQIVSTMIELGRAQDFIKAVSELIQRLAVDRLHIVGDIFDRGPGAEIIMDALMNHHSIDIQWGNHDILWMGAAAGSKACVANVIRICLRYGNTSTLETGYGINLLPLAAFALETYPDEKNEKFNPKLAPGEVRHEYPEDLLRKMHKAISIIQFKLEGQVIERRPIFEMEKRRFLDTLDLQKGTVVIEGKEWKLNDTYFPTFDKNNPYWLTDEEHRVISKLTNSFIKSDKLQTHTRFLYSKGSMYLTYNSNLLMHGCVPVNEDGSFAEVKVNGKSYKGKAFIDRMDMLAREGYYSKDSAGAKFYGSDVLWYLWCGPKSSVFGKEKMTTFERYFIDDKEAHKEPKNPYFKLKNDKEFCKKVLVEFGLDPENSHIVNGHVPVKVRKGEQPIKAGGIVIDIDGGFSKAYQPQTGIAGYTLIYNSFGMILVSHEPFESTKKAIEEEKDIFSSKILLESATKRIRIKDTDTGKKLKNQVDDLKLLLFAFKKGLIKELEVKG